MKNEQYYTVGTVLKSKKNIVEILIDWCLTPTSAVFQLYRGVEIGNIDTLNTQIHDRSISWCNMNFVLFHSERTGIFSESYKDDRDQQ